MNILFMMVPMALALGFGFVGAFLYCLKQGQFDDLKTPALRVLGRDEDAAEKKNIEKFSGVKNGNG